MIANDCLQDIINNLSENELLLAHHDIKLLRSNETLPEGCPLKRLERYIASKGETSENTLSEIIKCVLYRMADERASDLQTDHEATAGGWEAYGSIHPTHRLPVCLVHNGAETDMWDYGVFTDNVYGVPLGYFSDVLSAQKFILDQGYKCANFQNPIDY